MPDAEIEKLCRNNEFVGNIERQSGGDLHIGPSSMDLHVAPEKVRMAGGMSGDTNSVRFDVTKEETYPDSHTIEEENVLTVGPGEFCLARTDEELDLPPGIMAVMHGRSSVGRLGLFIENAGLVDRGFSGTLTLELYNPTGNVIEVPAYTRVGQLVFYHQGGADENSYDGKYQGQIDATESRMYEDFEK